MLRQHLDRAGQAPALRALTDAAGLLELRGSLGQVHVEDDVLGYVVRVLTATREHPQVTVGRARGAALQSPGWRAGRRCWTGGTTSLPKT